MTARRALVTGASGFLARHLIPALLSTGRSVAGADSRSGAPEGIGLLQGDLLDEAFVADVLKRTAPDEVYHLAGTTGAQPTRPHESNAIGAAKLMDAVAREAPGARIVLVGSAAEYGDVAADALPVLESHAGPPVTPYGRAKAAMSAEAREAAARGVNVAVARPFNPVGAGVPESLVVGALVLRLRNALAGPAPRRITVGDTRAVRDFVDAGEVAAGFIAVAERGRAGESYNLCSGQGAAVQDVLDQLLALAGTPVEVVTDQVLLRPGEPSRNIGSTEKSARELGWRARRPLADSLREAWDAAAPSEPAR